MSIARENLYENLSQIGDCIVQLEEDSVAGFKQASDRIDSMGRAIQATLQGLEARLTKLENPAPPSAQPKLALGAVTYYYPGAKWEAVLKHKPRVVVINPASGPGASFSRAYADQVGKAKMSGCTVLGYVATGYGKRPVDVVKAEMDKYTAWYALNGFFLDQGANTDTYLPIYADICTHARRGGHSVCINPGTKTTEGYAKIADWLMTFEGTAVDYMNSVRPEWEQRYSQKLWHVVHGCSVASMPGVVSIAKATRTGLIWVTDDVMNNPYDTNGSYLDALAAELAK